MQDIAQLLENNRRWARETTREDEGFFRRLAAQQSPRHLWIGCSDSRVPANQILGLPPGEVFVHRNVSNIAHPTDMNLMSVLEYAVDVLKVEHVMVVGHYGCGGVRAALLDQELGLIDNWLRHVRAIYRRQTERFDGLNQTEKEALLCELNVLDQARHVEETSIVRKARKRQQPLEIHAWVYGLTDGLLHDLNFTPPTP